MLENNIATLSHSENSQYAVHTNTISSYTQTYTISAFLNKVSPNSYKFFIFWKFL